MFDIKRAIFFPFLINRQKRERRKKKTKTISQHSCLVSFLLFFCRVRMCNSKLCTAVEQSLNKQRNYIHTHTPIHGMKRS